MKEELKKQLYKQAFINLYKKLQFQETYQLFLSNQISEEEFNEEIEKHPQKYIIDINVEATDDMVLAIGEILEEVGLLYELGTSDVEDLFSINLKGYKCI